MLFSKAGICPDEAAQFIIGHNNKIWLRASGRSLCPQDRKQQGCCARAPMDGFTACPEDKDCARWRSFRVAEVGITT